MPEHKEAYFACDTHRVLEPWEVIFQDQRGRYIEGDVVVVRNPCLAPWDAQKFRALGWTDLSERFANRGIFTGPPYLPGNVVIMSTHETCSLAPADYLAGGDYDGDVFLNYIVPITHFELFLLAIL